MVIFKIALPVKKILLIVPGRASGGILEYLFADRTMPLGAYYLQAYLLQQGIACEIYDLNIAPKKELPAIIDKYSVVGISTYLATLDNCREIVSIIRDISKNKIIIAGGPDASCRPEFYINERLADIVVLGEAEKTLWEICNKPELSEIRGIAYLDNNKFYQTDARERIKNLDFLPFPIRDEVYYKYRAGILESPAPLTFPLLLSRGCPMHCLFCSRAVFGNKLTFRSVDNIIEEIILLKKKFNAKYFFLCDDIFMVDKNLVKAFCERLIAGKINIRFKCSARVDYVDEELLSLLKAAGCFRIDYGVESMCQEVLDMMRKDITVEEIKRAFRLTKSKGIETRANIILGFPGETKLQSKQTLQEILRLKADHLAISYYVDYNNYKVGDNNKFRHNFSKRPFGHAVIFTYLRHYGQPKNILKIFSYIFNNLSFFF